MKPLDKNRDSAWMRLLGHGFFPFCGIIRFTRLAEGDEFWVGKVVDVGLEERDLGIRVPFLECDFDLICY